MSDDGKIVAKEQLIDRSKAYRNVFDTDEGEHLLKDLARFCRAHESTFVESQRLSDVLEGRREVWLRIQHHLKLTDEELWALHKRATITGL